jgi:cellulose synthase/poly-beta-1,6-N-acetylglucosamine synthase-like glycosyltransferase
MPDYNNIILFTVFSILATAASIQLFYYFFFYLAVYVHKPAKINTRKEPISIIICARNEAENLRNFLPSVLEQDYPDYEVIVVNDCSEDNSYEILGEFLKKYPHLKISTVNKDPKFTHFKRFAQFIGIKAAKNDILLFTDADCHPESDKWIEKMTSHVDDKFTFVLGYGGYHSGKGLLNKYVRYDCMTIAMQYLGMAIRGVPYMGVGRNLVYRRSVFFENKGFGSHNHLVSGDDDLFVNSNASRKTTCVEFGDGSHTRSVPVTTLKAWVTQKKRHLTTAPYYRPSHKVLLATEPLTRVLFYTSFTSLCITNFFLPFTLAIFGLRLITQITVLSLVQKKLKEPGLLLYSIFFDIFSPVINGILYLSNSGNKRMYSAWK